MIFYETTEEDKELIEIAPCGNCRQMLIEYSPEIKVILNDYENNLVKVGIKALIPFACL